MRSPFLFCFQECSWPALLAERQAFIPGRRTCTRNAPKPTPEACVSRFIVKSKLFPQRRQLDCREIRKCWEMYHLVLRWICMRWSQACREPSTHRVAFREGMIVWHWESIVGPLQKELFALVPDSIKFGAKNSLTTPYKESVIMICSNDVLGTGSRDTEQVSFGIACPFSFSFQLTLSQRVSVSEGICSKLNVLSPFLSIIPALHKDGSIMQRQSSKGNRRKRDRFPARSSAD